MSTYIDIKQQNMKPFSLEEYLANPTKKVVTRDGREARIICTDRRNTECPIVALINEECDEKICSYPKGGRFFYKELSNYDLFFAPETHEGWINIFKGAFINAKAFLGQSYIYSSEEIAKNEGKKYNNYLSTIKIEWEE